MPLTIILTGAATFGAGYQVTSVSYKQAPGSAKTLRYARVAAGTLFQTVLAMRVHKIHYGYNIRRLREIVGLKQAALAKQMGSGWSQKRISKLESKEWIKPDLLERVAEALGLPPQVIENFSEEALLHTLRQEHCLPPGACCQKGTGILKELMAENNSLYAQLVKAEKDKNCLLRCLTGGGKPENERWGK